MDFWGDIFEYLWRVICYLWLLLPGLFLEGLAMLKEFWQGWENWANRYFYTREQRSKIAHILLLVGFIIANFLAFRDAREETRVIQEKLDETRTLLNSAQEELSKNMRLVSEEKAMASSAIKTEGQSGGEIKSTVNNFQGANFNAPINYNKYYIFQRSEIAQSVPKNNSDLELNAIMGLIQKISGEKLRDDLSGEFPFGYSLVSITDNYVVIPKESPLTEEFRVDWESIKIIENAEQTIKFLLPRVYDRDTNELMFDANTFEISKDGKTAGFVCMGYPSGGRSIAAKTIVNIENGTILAVGIRPCTIPD